MLEASPGCCQEAHPASREAYIPCNAPATSLIGWPARGEGPYRMCPACAWHSVRNRGAEHLGRYPPEDSADA